jgi:hypothetical protein
VAIGRIRAPARSHADTQLPLAPLSRDGDFANGGRVGYMLQNVGRHGATLQENRTR